MSVLDSGRRMAESRMTDECAVTRVDPDATDDEMWDEEQGRYVPALITVYTGRCRIRHTSAAPADIEAGAQLLAVGKPEIHVPVGSPVFYPDDVVTITASATRPDQVGREFTVQGAFDGSQTTALRYRVEVADGR